MATRRATDYSRFTALPGSESLFSIDQDASPELQALAKAYPDYLKRALRHLAYQILSTAKAAIRAGGPAGTRWPERSRMHIYRRMEMLFSGRDVRLKKGTNSGKARLSRAELRRSGNPQGAFSMLGRGGERRAYRTWSKGGNLRDAGQSIPDAFTRWKAPKGGRSGQRNPIAMSGFIYGNLAYGPKTNALQYDIGALTPKTARALAEVQAGRNQVVTPAMRRAFWAAGVPISKGKTVISQPPRPLLDPIFRQMRPHFESVLIARIKGYIEGTTNYV